MLLLTILLAVFKGLMMKPSTVTLVVHAHRGLTKLSILAVELLAKQHQAIIDEVKANIKRDQAKQKKLNDCMY